MAAQATIVITRRRYFTNNLVRFPVILDGRQLTKIRNGDTEVYQVYPGNHSISFKINRWRESYPVGFEVSSGETATFVLNMFRTPACRLWTTRKCLSVTRVENNHTYVRPQRGHDHGRRVASDVQVNKVTVSSDVDRVPVGKEQIRLAQGSHATIRRSKTVIHEIEISNSVSTQFAAGLDLLGIVKGKIIHELERRQSRKLNESETVEYEVSVDPSVSVNWTLTWVDVWAMGNAAGYYPDGRPFEINFRMLDHKEVSVQPTSPE